MTPATLSEQLRGALDQPHPGESSAPIYTAAAGPLLLDDLPFAEGLREAISALDPAVSFRWAFTGAPASDEAHLLLLPLDDGESVVIYQPTEPPRQLLARLADAGDFDPFFLELVGSNGSAYDSELFQLLPTLTTNFRPDLLQEATVAAAYQAYMDGPAQRYLQAPWRELQRRLKQLQSPRHIRLGKAHGGRQRDRETDLPEEERQRLFHRYFDLSYKELR